MAAFRPHVFRALKREELLAGALGFFVFGGYAFQTTGLQYTTPSPGSSPAPVSLWFRFACHLLGTPLTLWVYGGVFAAVFGLYFLTVPAEGILHFNRGDLLTFVAAGLYAMHIILVGDYTRRHSIAALSVLQVAAYAALVWLATGLGSLSGWQPARFAW
jgi:hypothetical protein